MKLSLPNIFFQFTQVYGGPDADAPRLAQLCHTQTKPQQLSSTGNHMYVRFKSDVGRNGRGFRATFKAVQGGTSWEKAHSACHMAKGYSHQEKAGAKAKKIKTSKIKE